MSEADRIRNVDAWPLWPRLPVKKRGTGMPQIGFIVADEVEADGGIAIFKSSVFTHKTSKTEEFESLDAMLEAGWVGD